MKVHVKGGNAPVFYAENYITRELIDGTRESVTYAKDQLKRRQYHLLSALELKHEMSPGSINQNRMSHSCIYLIFDATAGEALAIDGMSKGYQGQGPRGAAAMDAFLDLLDIPVKRRVLSKGSIRQLKHEKSFDAPEPKLPRFSLENVGRAERRARKLHLKFNDDAGFDKLYKSMPLDRMLDVVNFEKHSYWNRPSG